jgi:flagellar protein FliS
MLAQADPAEAYRLVSRDAHIEGADAQALLRLCYDEAIAALDRAIFATDRQRWDLRGRALSRAASAVTALRRGVDPAHPLASALYAIYDAAAAAIAGGVSSRDVAVLHRVRNDLTDIASALFAPAQAA